MKWENFLILYFGNDFNLIRCLLVYVEDINIFVYC